MRARVLPTARASHRGLGLRGAQWRERASRGARVLQLAISTKKRVTSVKVFFLRQRCEESRTAAVARRSSLAARRSPATRRPMALACSRPRRARRR